MQQRATRPARFITSDSLLTSTCSWIGSGFKEIVKLGTFLPRIGRDSTRSAGGEETFTPSVISTISLWFLALVILASSGCSRQNLVAKATATATYYQQHYIWTCVDKKGPDSCAPCQVAVNTAATVIPIANTVYKIGPLPKAEQAELKALIKQLEACP